MIAAVGLAATAALALFCFVKAVGQVLLGPPRRPEVAAATEVRGGMRAAPVALAAGCVALGAVPGLLLPSLAALRSGPRVARRRTGPLRPRHRLAARRPGSCSASSR